MCEQGWVSRGDISGHGLVGERLVCKGLAWVLSLVSQRKGGGVSHAPAKWLIACCVLIISRGKGVVSLISLVVRGRGKEVSHMPAEWLIGCCARDRQG